MTRLKFEIPKTGDTTSEAVSNHFVETVDFKMDGPEFSAILGALSLSGRAILTAPNAGWLEIDGLQTSFYLTRRQDVVDVWINGHVYPFKLQSTEARRSGNGVAAAGLGGSEIKAPMPGTILKCLASQGDSVILNQPLIIMESMKMEMTLSAGIPGTVSAVRCEPGQLVEMGALLLSIKPLSEKASSKETP